MISLLFLLLMLGACGVLRGQSFEIKDDNLRVASLDGLWRFHTGDNPAWASPSFDDSKWSLLRSDQSWSSQGYKGYGGLAWYRFQVVVPAGMDHVSLYLPTMWTCFEVYADGSLIGTYGEMPPNTMPYSGGGWFQMYSIPAPRHWRQKIQIAVRVWHYPGWAAGIGGGPNYGGGLVGDSQEIEHRNALEKDSRLWSSASDLTLGLLETLAGMGALSLFLLRRREPEYLWFGLTMFLNAANEWISIPGVLWNSDLGSILFYALNAAAAFALIAFYRQLLRPKRTWPLRLAAASIALQLLLFLALILVGIFQPGLDLTWLPVGRLNALFDFIFNGCIITVVFTRARQGLIDARLLLVTVILTTSQVLFLDGVEIAHPHGLLDLTKFVTLTRKPFPILYSQAADFVFLLAVFAILILRFTRTRSQEERFAGEVQAARSVQQYLIPEHLPPTPGLAIESVYRPAREVGGDFFQVLPDAADGSVLIVVGDVAGHGMESGMLATLIVGAIRTAAEFTSEPGRILSLLNKRMQGRGLATCLALRIERDGSAALANAGHLPPYLNGLELPMEGALPLGAVLEIDFPVLHFKLADGDALMLMTDGVAEAQDKEGHLFGFDRIAEMLRNGMAAATLATAAQAFGQEDDITVLTVGRLAPAMIG
jgi:hypothetical protein